MINLIENKFKSGAIHTHSFRRKLKKLFRKKVARGLSFDWSKGYDVRDTVGPIAIKNQGENYSCGGQAGSYFLEIQRKLQGIQEGPISAKSIYAPINYPGGGTTVSDLINQIGAHGGNREGSVPSYDAYGNPMTEAMISEKSWITDTTRTDAITRAGYVPYDVGTNIDDVAAAIQAYGALVWEIRGQNNGTWLSPYPKPPTKNNSNVLFNHFMCAVGAKMVNGIKTITTLESMGVEVGESGIQYFQEDYFNSKCIVECTTFIYDTKLVPDPANDTLWADITRWFRIQWALANSLTA